MSSFSIQVRFMEFSVKQQIGLKGLSKGLICFVTLKERQPPPIKIFLRLSCTKLSSHKASTSLWCCWMLGSVQVLDHHMRRDMGQTGITDVAVHLIHLIVGMGWKCWCNMCIQKCMYPKIWLSQNAVKIINMCYSMPIFGINNTFSCDIYLIPD